MSDKRYKRQERRVAEYFKTQRTPLSGGNSKITRSDTLHEKLYIEQKDRSIHAVWNLYDDVQPKAKSEGKIPVICLTQPNRHGFLIVLNSKDFEYDEYKTTEIGIDHCGEMIKRVYRGLVFEFKEAEDAK